MLMAVSQMAEAALPQWMYKVKKWVNESDTVGCDPDFVRLPEEPFVVCINSYMTGINSRVHLASISPSVEGTRLERLHSPALPSVSVSLSYRGWGLSYSYELGERADDNFFYSLNSRSYGLEYRFRDSELEEGRMRTTMFCGYWVLQRKWYSHPCATIFSTYQLQSSGSWIAGVNYWHGSFKANNEAIPLDFRKLSLSHISVGLGYAYNFVFGQQHCVLHGMVMPLVHVWNRDLIHEPTTSPKPDQSFAADAIASLRFVYNQGPYLTGFQSGCEQTFSPLEDNLMVRCLDWNARLFVGYRF